MQSQGGTDIFVVQMVEMVFRDILCNGDGEDWANDCAVDSTGMHVVGQIEDIVDFGFISYLEWLD